MNYIDAMVLRLEERFPGKPVELLRLYALLILTTGTATTRENVHDAWAVWRAGSSPARPTMVPFAELPASEQERDEKYVVTIRELAAQRCTG